MGNEVVFNTSRAEEIQFSRLAGGRKVKVTTAGADTEVVVAHGLTDANGTAIVPAGFLVIGRDKAGVVYDSGTANTTTALNIKCSVATVALTLWVF